MYVLVFAEEQEHTSINRKILFARGILEMYVHVLRQHTIYVLVKFHGWLVSNGGDLNQLTRVDIQQYIRSLESSKKSASTINKIYSVLTVFSRFIKQPDIMEDIRIPEVRKIKHIAPKSLERNERNKLFRDVERNGSLRDIAIVYVFLLTGIRVSELCSLNREDVTMSERSGQIVVIGKGNVSSRGPVL